MKWMERRRQRLVSPEGAKARAACGAAYLDEVDPGWADRIDAATLTLGNGRCCVLGQLHGDFRKGLSRAALFHLSSAPRANLSPVPFGFLCVQGLDERWQELDYAYLDSAWEEEVRRRQRPGVRQAPSASPPAFAPARVLERA